MIFVNPSFFENEPRKIANISENGDVRNDVARFIGQYEKECLQSVLGECLYNDVKNSYTFDSEQGIFVLNPDATDAIKNLVNGLEYDKPAQDNFNIATFLPFGCGCGCGSTSCDKRYWKGFVQTDEYLIGTNLETSYRSFIADYIYYNYLLYNRSVTSGDGQQVITGENAATVQNFSKRIDAYNDFVFGVLGKKNTTSLYMFLRENKDDYPTWEMNCNIRFKDKY